MAQSVAEQIALLPEVEREAVLAGIDQDVLLWDWGF